MSVTSWINYQQAKKSLIVAAEEKLYQGSKSTQKFINTWFSYRFMDINVHARDDENIELLHQISLGWQVSDLPLEEYVKSDDWLFRVSKLQDDLINLSHNYNYINNIFIIDKQGNILFSTKGKENLGVNLFDGSLSTSKFSKTVFDTLQNGAILFSDIERYGYAKKLLSGFLTAPLTDNKGRTVGVFAIQLNLKYIFGGMVSHTEKKSSQVYYLVGQDGLLRSPINDDFSSILTRRIKTDHLRFDQLDESKGIISEYIGPAGHKVFGIHQVMNIKNIRWALLSEVDSDEVFQTSVKMASTLYWVLFFSVLIISFIVYLQAKRITTPLKKLLQSCTNVALGKNNQQVDIETNNEIGKLAHAFNQMLFKQQKNELEISNSNDQLRAALSEVSRQQYALYQYAIVTIMDRAGSIVFASDKFCDMSGYHFKQLIGANYRLLNSAVHSKKFFSNIFNYISGGLVWHGEICIRSQKGDLYWLETTISPYKDHNGIVQQFLTIQTDISKQKVFEQQQSINRQVVTIKHAITKTFANGRLLKEQLSESLLHIFELPTLNLKNKACVYVFNTVNKSLELIVKQGCFDIDQQHVIDKFIDIDVHELDKKRMVIKANGVALFCTESEEHGYYIVPLMSGENTHKIKNNDLIGLLLLFTEKNSQIDDDQSRLLSENATLFSYAILRERTKQSLQKFRLMAEKSCRSKDPFLATRSHETRTSRNDVLDMFNLLLNNELTAEYSLDLINETLDLLEIGLPEMELHLIDFNLRNMLGELVESMALRADEKGIEIILDVTQIEHSLIKGDSGRIRQIIANLMSNAIKFTEQGQVTISVSVQEIKHQQLLLQCHVEDSGIGIPEDEISTLFEMFTQIKISTTSKYDGTGLGLAICKKLSNLMSGDVQVKSEVGKGSIFSFTAQLHTSQRSQKVLPLVDISQLNLLIVDDNTVNLAVLRGQLEHWKANVTEANSGQHAFDICQQRLACGDKNFDIAFLDMHMPEMDGEELGKRLRADKQFDTMQLIMMDSLSLHHEAKFYREIGFNAYFTKPATTSDLFNVFTTVVTHGQQKNDDVAIVSDDDSISLMNSLMNEKPSNEKISATELSAKIILAEDNKIKKMLEHLTDKQDLTSWDKADALNRLLNSESLLVSLLITYIEEMPGKIDELTVAINDENKQQIAEV
ncbi:MAG: ATP-binding protein, partial [Psychromonas sp.]